ncbi:septation protein SepH [Mycolicibacterium sediminis]|uniref:DNA-binding protein n=1 Tax=Mycolicibacterium sediminis TaxID=1286180 RepID=A0A7I7R197_9MYCO|nr:septation protein SepH [Mycolicibacterium sediminis]BBY31900.1 DNA-binding protein [Mycolicibacterium sediminis]
MRELNVVGLDVDGKSVICESADSGEKFLLIPDGRLHAALRGDRVGSSKPKVEVDMSNTLRPKDIQSRIRAGASVEQVAEAAGVDIARVERFAHPVLLERSRAAELATAAHPVLADGPTVMTLLETVTTSLIGRGLDPDATEWDAWRNEDGRWTVQLAWKAGRSDNVAHFRFSPGSHGGTVTAFDDAASELVDPDFQRPPLRSVALRADAAPAPKTTAERPADEVADYADDFDDDSVAEPQLPLTPPIPEPSRESAPESTQKTARTRRRKPEVPAWEDVLLGVRSGTQP